MEQESKKFCFKLLNAIYDGIDVQGRFMKTLCKFLRQDVRRIQSHVDPCLYYWKDRKGKHDLMAVVYLDLTEDKRQEIRIEVKKISSIYDLGKLEEIWNSGMSWEQMKARRFTSKSPPTPPKWIQQSEKLRAYLNAVAAAESPNRNVHNGLSW